MLGKLEAGAPQEVPRVRSLPARTDHHQISSNGGIHHPKQHGTRISITAMPADPVGVKSGICDEISHGCFEFGSDRAVDSALEKANGMHDDHLGADSFGQIEGPARCGLSIG
jgi:hypothetical protein